MREDQKPKYLNTTDTPIFQKGENVYNAPAARKAAYAGNPLRVVEGYTDVIAMVSAGHPATVATLGTAVTAHQLAMLWKWSAEPVFCLDGDDAGRRAQAKVIDLALPGLGDGRSVQFVSFPAGEDPDSLLRGDGAEALAGALDAARPLAEALWAREVAQGPTDTPERCEALKVRLRAAVDTIKDKGVRGAYGQHLAKALGAHFRGHEIPGWHPGTTSKFGRLSWRDQDLPVSEEYSWWVKGLIPKGETIAVVGQTQTGKSFETFNMAMHVAQGLDYRGCRTQQGLVIYCAMEGGKGFRDRLRGYRKHHNIPLENIPFEVLTRRADLFGSETDIRELIAEVQAIAAEHSHQLAFVVIDTYSAATPGLKENASEDISRVRKRIVQIEQACHCGVIVVDHTNATGEKVRGHTSKTADIETQLDIAWVTRIENRHPVTVTDDDGREIRRITVRKQREGKSGQHWDFVLKAIEVRKDSDGDPVTTCVTTDPARSADDRDAETGTKSEKTAVVKPGYFKLSRNEVTFFKALLKAVEAKGVMPPPGVDVPPGVSRIVIWDEVKRAYTQEDPNDEGDTPEGRKKYAARVKIALRRARDALRGFNIMGVSKLPGEEGQHIVWPTGRRVWGLGFEWPPALRAVAGGKSDATLAPGETMEDLLDGFEPEIPE